MPGDHRLSEEIMVTAQRAKGARYDMAVPAPVMAMAPPPPPAATVWHVADNGATKGPFGEGDLAAMVANGSLTRATMVWTAGQDGWKAAGDTALARLFAQVPPPPPPPAP